MVELFKLLGREVRFDQEKNRLGLGTSIINLSSHELSDNERSVLKKGLKFVPYQTAKRCEITEGFNNFSRKIKLSYFFQKNTDQDMTKPRLYQEKSSWLPSDKYFPAELHEELEALKLKLDKIRIIHDEPNLSLSEYQALKSLSKNDDLVFKKADKGSAIVIMDKDNYISEALSQLNKTKYYEEIPEPIFKQTFPEVNSILTELMKTGWLTPKQYAYLAPKESARERIFYSLPKVHKPKNKWHSPIIPVLAQ